MYYSFILHKSCSSPYALLDYFKAKVPESQILKIESLPESTNFSTGYKNFVSQFKQTVMDMYTTSKFVTIEVNQNSETSCKVWRITLKCKPSDLKIIQQIQLISSIASQNFAYESTFKQPMQLSQLIVQDTQYSYFSNLKFNDVLINQFTFWTYIDNTILVNIVFTFKTAHRISLIISLDFDSINIKYYERTSTMHFVIVPSTQPLFYYSQISFDSYSYPLLQSHYSIPNLFFPQFQQNSRDIEFRLILSKQNFDKPQCRQFCSRLKQLTKQDKEIVSYQRIEYAYMYPQMFNYQFYYEGEKKQPEPQLTTSYIISKGQLKHNISTDKIFQGLYSLFIISNLVSESVLPNIIGKQYQAFINAKGQFKINMNKKQISKNKNPNQLDYSLYKLVGKSKDKSNNSKLFLIKSQDFAKLKIDWSSRRLSLLSISEQIMPLDSIECSSFKSLAFNNYLFQQHKQNQCDVFLGFIDHDLLCKNKIYQQNIIIYGQFQKIKGYFMVINQPKDSKTDLQLISSYDFNNKDNKLSVFQIQSQHHIYLTDFDIAFLTKTIPLSELIRAQQQTMQLLLFSIQQYYDNKQINPILNLIAPAQILKQPKITYHLKQSIKSKFQRIKRNLPIGIQLYPMYNSDNSPKTISSIKGKYLFIYWNRRIVKIPQQYANLHPCNTTSFVLLPLNHKSIFQDEKIVVINNPFLIEKLSQNIPGIQTLEKYSYLPYHYSYQRFVLETLSSAEYKSLFKTDINIRNPYLPSQVASIQSNNSSLIQLNKLIEERVQISGCQSYIDLMIDHENISEFYLLWKAYKQILRKMQKSVLEKIKEQIKKSKTRYEQIHHLFLLQD